MLDTMKKLVIVVIECESYEVKIGLGYSVQTCLTDFGETAEAVVQSQLKQKRFDCILIGAGVRANPSNFMLFEKLINVVHEHAPQAKICFNTLQSDTAAAVKRWL